MARALWLLCGSGMALALFAVWSASADEPKAYPVAIPAFDKAQAEKLVATFRERNGPDYLGIADNPVAWIRLALHRSGKDLGPNDPRRTDAEALKAACDFLQKNEDLIGLKAAEVDAAAVWFPGRGAVVGFTRKAGAAGRYSYWPRPGFDAIAEVIGDPPRVVAFDAWSFPLPPGVTMPEAKLPAEEARRRAVGQPYGVIAAGSHEDKPPLKAEAALLGEVRPAVLAENISQKKWVYRTIFEVDVRAAAEPKSLVVARILVDAVTGEVVGQVKVPPPYSRKRGG